MVGKKLRACFAESPDIAREKAENAPFTNGGTELWLRVTAWQGVTWVCAIDGYVQGEGARRSKPSSVKEMQTRRKDFVALAGGDVAKVKAMTWDDSEGEVLLVIEVQC
mgnify:FL=1